MITQLIYYDIEYKDQIKRKGHWKLTSFNL